MKKSEEMNPFVINNNIKAVKVINSFLRTPIERGDVKCNSTFASEDSFYTDQSKRTSVYRMIKEESNEFLTKATPSAIILRSYIIDRIGEDIDYIRLTQTRLNDDIGMNHRTFSRAVKELVYWEYIEKKNRFEYWVNPHKIFHGNRVRFYQAMGMVNVVRSN